MEVEEEMNLNVELFDSRNSRIILNKTRAWDSFFFFFLQDVHLVFKFNNEFSSLF